MTEVNPIEIVPNFKHIERETWDAIKDRLPNSCFTKNRSRFLSLFKDRVPLEEGTKAFSLFKGANEVPMHATDFCYPHYQEAYFYYLFGAIEMDCYGLIDMITGVPMLFVQRTNNLDKIWMTVMSAEDFATKYEMEVHYLDELPAYLQANYGADATVYVNKGTNSDSKLVTQIPDQLYLEDLSIDYTTMHDILAEARTVKNEEEILALRWASQIASESHVYVMQNCKPGMRESQLESFFVHRGQQDYYIGRVQPYLSICGCGPSAATLHYQENDGQVVDGQVILTDQGHSFQHYTSDITISFPVNGRFTQKQAQIYNIVLEATRAVYVMLKPGVNWLDCHKKAERVILTGLKALGCLHGDVDEMLEKRISFLFMPCGLGHFIGLDIHDVGGYLPWTPERSSVVGHGNLRTARIIEAGNVITIEPGVYFRDFLLDGDVPQDFYEFDLSYIDREKIREFQQEVGGVRIEDVVLVTEDGNENLSYDIPRTVHQIEACMAGSADWRDL